MNFIDVVILAIALSMDAFAVAIACGFSVKQPKISHALKVGAFFGGFQAIMPLLGWLAGSAFRIWITNIDHWVAFGLLFFIGLKMLLEGVKPEKDADKLKSSPFETKTLLVLAIATSIDALAAGIGFSFLKTEIITPATTIGLITFLFSFIGVKLGSKVGHYLEHKVKIAGGLILIALGIKILIEHLAF